jgi:hypothetical protein
VKELEVEETGWGTGAVGSAMEMAVVGSAKATEAATG